MTGIASLSNLLTNSGLSAIFFAIFIAALIWQRTGTIYPLLSRLWIIFHGKKDCAVPSIQRHLEEQAALMQFRFTSGIRSRTIFQTEALIAWAQKHNENVIDIANCGYYFDFEEVRPKTGRSLPQTWEKIIVGLLLSVFLGIFVLSTMILMADSALLRFTKSGNWFWANTVSVTQLWSQQGFRLSDCSDAAKIPAIDLGFTKNDVAIICSKRAEITDQYIRTTVSDQRWTMLGLLPGTIYFLCIFIGLLKQFVYISQLLKRLGKETTKSSSHSDKSIFL